MLLNDLIKLIFKGGRDLSRFLFRLDAGRKQGLSFGHLMRCHYLSQALRRQGASTVFMMKDLPDGVNQAEYLGEKVWLDEPGAFKTAALENQAVIFDLPEGPDPEDLRTARELGLWTVVMDDVNQPLPWANVVLNSSILAVPDKYPRWARLLLGPEYLILPDDHSRARRIPRGNGELRQVLVTFGGSDPTGLTVRTAAALAENPWEGLRFQLVVGPGNTDAFELRRIAGQAACLLEIVERPTELLPLFCRADLAITAGGRTLYELHHLGVPTLAIASTAPEAQVVRAFKTKGWLQHALEAWDAELFLEALKQSLAGMKPAARLE
ncbi:MAG: hypothetical protein V1742_13080 [Pseudomonadota bacterium]